MKTPHIICAPPKLWHLLQPLVAAGAAVQFTPLSQLRQRRRPFICRRLRRTLALLQPN